VEHGRNVEKALSIKEALLSLKTLTVKWVRVLFL
jgi:hypothetical protein